MTEHLPQFLRALVDQSNGAGHGSDLRLAYASLGALAPDAPRGRSVVRAVVRLADVLEALGEAHGVLTMVRDADSDVKADGGPGMPPFPRARLEGAIAAIEILGPPIVRRP